MPVSYSGPGAARRHTCNSGLIFDNNMQYVLPLQSPHTQMTMGAETPHLVCSALGHCVSPALGFLGAAQSENL